jgi:predicted membrane metal-binding protein
MDEGGAMRVWWIAFALGVVVLQRQAALPGAGGWAGAAIMVAVCGAAYVGSARCARSRPLVALRWVLCACIASAVGFGYAAARAEWRLRDGLPVEWEGRDIVVTGVIRGLPAIDETGARLLLAVESNDAALARFAPLIRLSWRSYGEPAARGTLPALHGGQRWRLVARMKRPHAEANPGVRDSEAAWLAAGIRAIGYVVAPERAILLDERASGWLASIDRMRDTLRMRIGDALGDERAIAASLPRSRSAIKPRSATTTGACCAIPARVIWSRSRGCTSASSARSRAGSRRSCGGVCAGAGAPLRWRCRRLTRPRWHRSRPPAAMRRWPASTCPRSAPGG